MIASHRKQRPLTPGLPVLRVHEGGARTPFGMIRVLPSRVLLASSSFSETPTIHNKISRNTNHVHVIKAVVVIMFAAIARRISLRIIATHNPPGALERLSWPPVSRSRSWSTNVRPWTWTCTTRIIERSIAEQDII